MMQRNVTELQNMMETLSELRNEVLVNKILVIESISEIRKKLRKILEIEEERYASKYFPNDDVVEIWDEKLNALFDGIGFLGVGILHPKEINIHIDDAIMRLRICVTD